MLDIQLELDVGSAGLALKGEIWNASALAARSDYGFRFEQRSQKDGTLLKAYPRWCESVRGIVARCLALSNESGSEVASVRADGPLPDNWSRLQIRIALRPGGRDYTPLDCVLLERHPDGHRLTGTEVQSPVQLMEGFNLRAKYADPWELAEHALRMLTFGRDVLPAPVALNFPTRQDGDLQFVCTGDVPQPARAVFGARMRHSAQPVIAGHPDAVYAWDWLGFLGRKA